MTNFLLLIGAGLFSKAVGRYQGNAFNHLCVLSFADSAMLEADIQPALVQMQTMRGGTVQARLMCEGMSGTSTAATLRTNWTTRAG